VIRVMLVKKVKLAPKAPLVKTAEMAEIIF
jgi:hypothetical protein